ncbi:MAG: trimethylamine methyltransferase family protein [Gammaproteobacteria bacterium]
MSEQTEGGRSRRRRRRRTGGGHAPGSTKSPPRSARYRHLRNPYEPIEILSEDQIESIHENSLRVLEELGIRVLLPEGRQIFRAAGADVDEDTMIVRLDRDLALESVSKAPAHLTLCARNPERNVEVGGNAVAFSSVGGTPNTTDLERGRRPGVMKDLEDLMRLTQSFDVLHILGQSTEATDIDASIRHLDVTYAQLTLSDKFPFVYSRGREPVADAFEMLRIAHGLSEDEFTQAVYCHTVVNTNSPRQIDIPMALGIIDFARSGQLNLLTPFTLSGAMAPVTLAGALTLQNAEALAGIALAQIVRPGAPVAYGGFTSNVDMKSGAPAFGTPEYTKAAFASGQLARRYHLPWRSSNVNASNAPDAQAAYESQMSLWGALMGGAHILKHGAGWLEGGLVASFEKFIIDVEMLQSLAEIFEPLRTDEAELAFDALQEVAPGGHFFGAAHTMARYTEAFYPPLVSDWRNHGAWTEAGAPDAARRAHAIYKQTLEDYEPPPIDPAVDQALRDFVARRKAEGGAQLA